MFVNSVPNSVLSQNWVKCIVCTPMAQATRTLHVGPAVSWCTRRRVAGLARPCCSARPTVSRAVLRVPCRHAPLRVAAHIAAPYRVAPLSRYPVTKPPSCHDTIYCIATHSLNSQAPVRALLALARWPAVSQGLYAVSQAETSAVSWPTMRAYCALCHDTVYCIVTQNRKWAVAQPTAYNVFFFLILAIRKTTKKIYIYFFHFLVEPNKFIKKKFMFYTI